MGSATIALGLLNAIGTIEGDKDQMVALNAKEKIYIRQGSQRSNMNYLTYRDL